MSGGSRPAGGPPVRPGARGAGGTAPERSRSSAGPCGMGNRSRHGDETSYAAEQRPSPEGTHDASKSPPPGHVAHVVPGNAVPQSSGPLRSHTGAQHLFPAQFGTNAASTHAVPSMQCPEDTQLSPAALDPCPRAHTKRGAVASTWQDCPSGHCGARGSHVNRHTPAIPFTEHQEHGSVHDGSAMDPAHSWWQRRPPSGPRNPWQTAPRSHSSVIDHSGSRQVSPVGIGASPIGTQPASIHGPRPSATGLHFCPGGHESCHGSQGAPGAGRSGISTKFPDPLEVVGPVTVELVAVPVTGSVEFALALAGPSLELVCPVLSVQLSANANALRTRLPCW